MFRRNAASTQVPDVLDAAARRRLQRFGEEFDQVGATDFVMFAGPATPDEHLQQAMDLALEELHAPSRRAAVKHAVGTIVEAAQRRYSERFGIAELLGMGVRGSTAEDRVRVFTSLERAVVAVILWDRLADDTRIALAGPWSELVEAAVGAE